jgi:hypothetical protein
VTRIGHKVSQFADDTSLILDGSEKSLNEALLELDRYAKLSGLNINWSSSSITYLSPLEGHCFSRSSAYQWVRIVPLF